MYKKNIYIDLLFIRKYNKERIKQKRLHIWLSTKGKKCGERDRRGLFLWLKFSVVFLGSILIVYILKFFFFFFAYFPQEWEE